MDNKFYFRLGGKSYDLTETRASSDIWYEWVENAKPFVRRMKISRGILMWLCNRFREASVIKEKVFYLEMQRYFYHHLLQLEVQYW